MATGFVDSASISQVVQCLGASVSQPYPWSIRTAIDLTSLFLGTDNQHIAPGLSRQGGCALDAQDYLIDRLLENHLIHSLNARDLSSSVLKNAELNLNKWVANPQNIKTLGNALNEVITDQHNYGPWIDEVVSGDAWTSHAVRHGGLFEKSLTSTIAQVLDISQEAAEELHKQSRNLELLQHLSKHRGSDFEWMCKAYMLSALIRGKYHDEVARKTKLQLVQHPFRETIFTPTKGSVKFKVTRPSHMLSLFILGGAMQQRDLKDKLDCWVDNISRVRSKIATKRARLDDTETDHAAYDVAKAIARDANITMADKRVYLLLDILSGLAIGTLTSICLNPYIGVPLGAMATTALNNTEVYNKATNWFHLHGDKIKKLSAGRIIREWE
jgi:hypothetical protein